MESVFNSLIHTEFISVWVRDPRPHRDDFWHTHIDYEICLHTNSMCFRKKTSCVRRRYSEFVWLRRCLQQNALNELDLPKLPPWNPFFSLSNKEQLNRRMRGLQAFLEIVLHTPLLLSDSRLHLFLQSQLTVGRIERCAQGQTRYSVAQAVQRAGTNQNQRFPKEDQAKMSYDSDWDSSSSSSSSLGLSLDTAVPPGSRDPELFLGLSASDDRNVSP